MTLVCSDIDITVGHGNIFGSICDYIGKTCNGKSVKCETCTVFNSENNVIENSFLFICKCSYRSVCCKSYRLILPDC